MQDRQQHQQEIRAFLQKHFSSQSWEFSLPQGSGNETYFAHNGEHTYFIKLGAHATKYQVMATIGLTPQLLATGSLEDGTSLIVQPYIAGRQPSRQDYQNHLERFATAISMVHHSPELKQVLPKASSDLYSVVALESLGRLRERWQLYKSQVPKIAGFIDESLDYLGQQVNDFKGTGLIASHNDICNANWLISQDSQLYLIDLESMSLDDPAVDIGATLWWYYPPELRQKFLKIVGHANDLAFENRMQVRMAMHCLSITIPRKESFDKFDPALFDQSLTDFKTILGGGENPQGYER